MSKIRQDPKASWCALVNVQSGTASQFRMVGKGKRAYLHIVGREPSGLFHAAGDKTLRAIAEMIVNALDGKDPEDYER